MDTKKGQSTLQSPISLQLYLTFELSQKQWKPGFTVGMGQRPRIHTIHARDLQALQWEVREARRCRNDEQSFSECWRGNHLFESVAQILNVSEIGKQIFIKVGLHISLDYNLRFSDIGPVC